MTTSVIYDAKSDTIYVGWLLGNRWYLEYEDKEINVKARTRPNVVFGKQLFLIGDL